MKLLLAAALAGLTLIAPARAATTLCTLIADLSTGAMLLDQGEGCDTPTTPASTFKVPLAVIGFDSGFLADANNPVLPFQQGYADWGGDEWRQPTDPRRWMDYSVVWYSQRITHALGAATLARYATAFSYGNADFAGDPGADNGLDRAWISSSLKLTPREQLAFVTRLFNRQLPVSAAAMESTIAILQPRSTADGWQLLGKTGSAFPRKADGNLDRTRGWGWYVGAARKGDTTLVFVRLTQNDGTISGHGGIWTRDALLEEWPELIGTR